MATARLYTRLLARPRSKESVHNCGHHHHPRIEVLLCIIPSSSASLQPGLHWGLFARHREGTGANSAAGKPVVESLQCGFWSHVQCARLTQRTAKRSQFSCHICRAEVPKWKRGTNNMIVRIPRHILPALPTTQRLTTSATDPLPYKRQSKRLGFPAQPTASFAS